MRRLLLALFSIFLFAPFSGPAEILAAPDQRELLLKRIEFAESDPLSQGAKEAYAEIVRFASESDSVQVILSEKLFPWANRDLEYKIFLFGSFVAGNLKSQLRSKTKKDDSYAGALAMIRTYKRIREVNESFILSEIEILIRMQEEGTLRDYTRTVAR